MNWKIILLKFFRNVLLGVIFGILVLGIFGYLIAGQEGAVNGAYWGAVFGLIGGFTAGIGVFFEARFWEKGENLQMFPEWNWFVKKSDEKKKNY